MRHIFLLLNSWMIRDELKERFELFASRRSWWGTPFEWYSSVTLWCNRRPHYTYISRKNLYKNIGNIEMTEYCTVELRSVGQAKPFPYLDVRKSCHYFVHFSGTFFLFVIYFSLHLFCCHSLQQQQEQQQSPTMSSVLNHVNGNSSRTSVNERQQVERRLSIINHDIDTKKAAIKNIRLLLQQTSVTE